jgi:hypothetical protein
MLKAIRKFWVRTGVLLGAALLACMPASAGPVVAAPVGQAGTGTITGQVLSLDNVPLPDVRLGAFDAVPSPDRVALAEVRSDAQGRFSVQVPAGTIWMFFFTQDIRGESFWGYSNLPVDVAAGATVSGQDFRVAIRVVSVPEPAPAPAPAPVAPPPGMPSTGAGLDLALPLAGGIGLLLFALGLVQRRRAMR